MLLTVNSIFFIIILFIGTFLTERYVLLEPAMEEKKQRIFYMVSFLSILMAFVFIGEKAQFLILLFGGLNIAIARKKHKLLGLLTVIPVIGIMNGLATPIFMMPFLFKLEYADHAVQAAILVVYLVVCAFFLLFYFKGKKWREWFRENMGSRKLDRSEYIIIFVSGVFMMFFSRINEYVMTLNLGDFYQNSLDPVQTLFFAYDAVAFILSVAIIVMVLQGNKRKFYYKRVETMQSGIIFTMAELVESRDDNTGGHIARTAKYVEIIGEKLMADRKFPEVLTEQYLADMVIAAPLHDIGKIHIPDAILNKPGRLTDEEFEIMKTHTVTGCEVLEKAREQLGEFSYLNIALEMARSHHEWMNGKGYPDRVSGESIPLCARIMAVADVFDALVSKRCYKAAMPLEKAYGIIMEESGTHFDPVVAEAFLSSKEEVEKVCVKFTDG